MGYYGTVSEDVDYNIELYSPSISTFLTTKSDNDTVYLRQYIRNKEPIFVPQVSSSFNSNGDIIMDTIYVSEYFVKNEKKLKIPLERAMIENIKEVITNHLKIEKILLERHTTEEGMVVRFYIDYYGGRLSASYSNIGSYTNVSYEFKLLIDSLIKQDIRFKEYIDKYYFDYWW
jgi:hypothetical protein